MNYQILLTTAFRSIRHHKGRSLLTTLGIIIGIASIIAILAIGQGAEERVKRNILSGGNNFIFIHPGNWLAQGKDKKGKKDNPPPFIYQDIDSLKQNIGLIKKISPAASSNQTLCAMGKHISIQVKSGNQDLLDINDRQMAMGQFFNQSHVQRGARVIILGHKIAHELFKHSNPLGRAVQIKKMNLTVIGVIKKMGAQLDFGSDPNMDVFIPISTAQKLGMAPRGNSLSGLFMSANNTEDIPYIVKQVRKILRARRKLAAQDPDDFMIWDQASMLKAAKSSSAILTLLLLIIASISLIVGGIGVMNIMLVSVRERTQEIGIRMALGASQKIILWQFLLEALTLCSFGGILGIALGIAIPYLVSMLTGWLVIITPLSVISAFLAMFVVGLLFGYYPALKASRLEPVQALTQP